MSETIKAVTHPVPTEYAQRIYEGKTAYIGKRSLSKVKKGDKFVLYESHGAKAYTGWADIIKVEKVKKSEILEKYGNQLMLTPEEFQEYSKKRVEMNIIEFENFELFKKKVVPKRFIAIGGKYIYSDEFEMIKKNKE